MRRKIIYLDDEPVCLRVFEAAFGVEFDVRLAETPEEARALLSQGAPDVFICDQCLGGATGTDFLAEVAALCPSSYRVLLTGTAALGDVFSEFSSRVVEAFVTKPWTEDDVRQLVTRAEVACAFPEGLGYAVRPALLADPGHTRTSWPTR